MAVYSLNNPKTKNAGSAFLLTGLPLNISLIQASPSPAQKADESRRAKLPSRWGACIMAYILLLSLGEKKKKLGQRNLIELQHSLWLAALSGDNCRPMAVLWALAALFKPHKMHCDIKRTRGLLRGKGWALGVTCCKLDALTLCFLDTEAHRCCSNSPSSILCGLADIMGTGNGTSLSRSFWTDHFKSDKQHPKTPP